jgi:dienelactone hydrolase
MQLVRVIEVGIDADGDGAADLDPSRIYYAGFSNGAILGTAFAAVESSVRAAVLNAAGGLVGDSLRLSPIPSSRDFLGALLASREPSLINPPGITTVDGVPLPSTSGQDVQFNENMPLRNDSQLVVRLADGTSQTILSPVVNTVPGAMQIQQLLEHIEWAYMPVDPAAFAPYLRKAPLASRDERPVIVQFAKGDQGVTNPTTTAILRAGDLADWTTYYRTDRAVATYGTAPGVAKNPHVFLLMRNTPTRAAIARAAQEQIAVFFESDGTTVIDPNEVLLQLLKAADLPVPLDPLFEVSFQEPLPEELEELNFIP